MQVFDEVATGVITDLAETLQLQSTVFTSLHTTTATHLGASCLETIHYMAPSMTDASLDANASASCEAHVDKGLLTLIFPDTAQGLQVKHT